MKIKNNLTHEPAQTKRVLQLSLLSVFLFVIYIGSSFWGASDIPFHAVYAQLMSNGTIPYSGTFILYWLANIMSSILLIFGPSLPDLGAIEICLCILMVVATAGKLRLVENNISEHIAGSKRFWIALSLIFVVAIPIPSIFITGNFYFGNFMPNVWHNTTVIFLFPFAILLFIASMKQMEDFCHKRNLWITLLVFLNIFIKPSYFFAWVSVYPLFWLIKNGFTVKTLKGLIPVIIGVVMLLVQYIIIYHISEGTAGTSSVINAY